ncbi:MAG: hypothetical protein U1F10_11725 [Burkholderiales bacterium]
MPGTWREADAGLPALTFQYSFGPALSRALAVGIADGLAVASPPCRVPGAVLDALAARGPVRALVATNAFHHLGIPEWRRRFPEATVYAPAQSVARVGRKTGLPVRPLAELAARSGPHVDFIDMPHYRMGETLIRMRTGRGVLWYVTDAVFNFAEVPPNFGVGFLFRVTGSAPGLRFNNLGTRFMVRDRPALKRWLLARHDEAPPAVMIPAHGEVADVADGRLRTVFAT